MKSNKHIVIVGGVAGGMSFATRYRRLNSQDQITIFDKGPYVSFANCGLPYYVGGEINKRDKLIVANSNSLKNDFNLNIETETEVLDILSDQKKIKVKNKDQVKFVSYDKLILSPGAKPFVPNIEGINRDFVFTLRNIPDVDNIMEYIKLNKPKKAVVIGGGFIGIEMAENLSKKGLEVSVVEMAPYVLAILDPEMAKIAEEELEKNGIKLYVNSQVTKVNHNNLEVNNETMIDTDLIILSSGVLPDSTLAKTANIETGIRGGIIVNEKFETNIPDIYAIGDAIIVKNYITLEDSLISLASPANRQGRQLADILNGINVNYQGTLGTSILRLFNLTIASTGLNERQLKNRPYKVLHLSGNDHAGYYPGASRIYLKVIFDPNTLEILGSQAIGKKGVDKRIDVIATAIKAKMKVTDLQELELAYAPPYGSAKDIINMVGYVSQNIVLGITNTVQWYDVERLVNEGCILVDVRTKEEITNTGMIKGAIHIQYENLHKEYDKLPKNKKIILYCQSGVRSYNSERILRNLGYDAYNLDGSFNYYQYANKKGVEQSVFYSLHA